MKFVDKTITELEENYINVSCGTHDIDEAKEKENYNIIIIYDDESNKDINNDEKEDVNSLFKNNAVAGKDLVHNKVSKKLVLVEEI